MITIGAALTGTASTTIRAVSTTTTTNVRQAGAVTQPPAVTTDTTPMSIPPNETVVPVLP